MNLSPKKLALPTAVVIPSAIVVIVLAVLQYRWSNQVSEATSVRLADSLQMSMINWHLDLYRNISEICLAMRADLEDSRTVDLDRYADRLTEWRAKARYPDLVSNVYILKPDEVPALRWLQLYPSPRRFQPAELSPGLLNVREKIHEAFPKPSSLSETSGRSAGVEELNSSIDALSARDGFYPVADPFSGWRFDPNLPALVRPIAPGVPASIPSRNDWTKEWMVIELNRNALQNQIVPALTQAYFRGTEGLDYQVTVVSGEMPRHLIYSSDSGFGEDAIVDADGTMDIFGRPLSKEIGSPIRIFHTSTGSGGLAAAVGISWFPLLGKIPESQDWRLVVRHRRGGPLGAFVAEMRHRDLAISAGALLLLVLNMAMLIITRNSAQRLAKLQMDFVTAVSHELRTPLTVIRSAAYNIVHRVVEGKERLTQYGLAIEDNAKQLQVLVEQILLFAATRRGPLRYNLRRLEVSEVIEATLASSAELIREAEFTVECKIDRHLPPIMGDAAALTQCLQNLVTNALKYGRKQRWIGIKAFVGESDAKTREIHISVSDRGSGIAPAELPHIFKPFYRSPLVVASQIHGTGLGLPVARSIVEAFNGRLTVASTLGSGSTFTLRVPCAQQALHHASAERSAVTAP